MPFTFSHPAIVLPLNYINKRWLSPDGLIIGSLTPDFEYFMRMKVNSIYSHTWLGLLWFDLPVGLMLLFVYLIVVKDRLIDNLPTILHRRFAGFKHAYENNPSQRYLLVASLSILIGGSSHILWDGFTHSNGLFVYLIPILSDKIRVGGHEIFVYKIIQHTSTLIGAMVIIMVVYKLPFTAHKTSSRQSFFWTRVMVVVIAVLIIRFLTGLTIKQYGDLIVTVISGGLLGLIISSIIVNIKQKSRSRREQV